MAFIGCLLLQLATVLVPTIANKVFGIDDVWHWRFVDWLIVLALSVTPLVIVEMVKLVNKFSKKKVA